jgi:hypothetical protein
MSSANTKTKQIKKTNKKSKEAKSKKPNKTISDDEESKSQPKCKEYIAAKLAEGLQYSEIRNCISHDFKNKDQRNSYYKALGRCEEGKTIIK